jgi:hypothetical protein
MTHLTPHDFLRHSPGQRQQLVANLALLQRLLELPDAFVGDLCLVNDDRNVLELLSACCRARLDGSDAPSLLPAEAKLAAA